MDSVSTSVGKVQIVYYSGTGSTRKVSECFEEILTKRGITVKRDGLTGTPVPLDESSDLLLMIYAVHGLNAPEAVYHWIEGIQGAAGKRAAVISVSGGGEASPNTACRVKCIKKLEMKGFDVTYERMLVMPSNWIVSTKEPLAVMLLEVLPDKVQLAIDEVLAGARRRTKPPLIDRALSRLGELEKTGARQFGKNIRRSQDCNGCGWCVSHCPAGNIKMDEGRPVFMKKCHMCLNCIYGCPRKALSPGMIKFITIKEGYSLKALEEKVPNREPVDVEALAKGFVWKGVKKYLLIRDF